jgi:Cu(I)/Ag(I) efflux system periplasmic protein CusF
MYSPIILAAIAALAIGTNAAFAQAGHHGHGAPKAPTAATSAAATNAAASAAYEGTVRRLDAAGQTVTIAHGPMEGLGMSAMTMVFVVADSVTLDGISAGDKIRFAADQIDGTLIVTAIEPAN